MCLAAVRCRVDSYMLASMPNAHCSIYAVHCSACHATPRHAKCPLSSFSPRYSTAGNISNSHVQYKQYRGGEQEQCGTSGVERWRGREWVLGNSLAGNKPSANQPQPSFKSSSQRSFLHRLSHKEMLMTQIVWVTNNILMKMQMIEAQR